MHFNAFWGETIIVINLAAYSERVRLSEFVFVGAGKARNTRSGTTSACVNLRMEVLRRRVHPPSLQESHTCSRAQVCQDREEKTIDETNMQALSPSLKSLESIFLYCSQAVRICLNGAQLKGI